MLALVELPSTSSNVLAVGDAPPTAMDATLPMAPVFNVTPPTELLLPAEIDANVGLPLVVRSCGKSRLNVPPSATEVEPVSPLLPRLVEIEPEPVKYELLTVPLVILDPFNAVKLVPTPEKLAAETAPA